MIQKQSHTTVYVLDQDKALAFYRDKLGFEVMDDQTMKPGLRWLTVAPKGQTDLQLILMPTVASPMMPEARAKELQALVEAGTFGIGVFVTSDVHKTYEELQAKGVTTLGKPEERPYGIELVVKDDSGNWFSLVQRPKS